MLKFINYFFPYKKKRALIVALVLDIFTKCYYISEQEYPLKFVSLMFPPNVLGRGRDVANIMAQFVEYHTNWTNKVFNIALNNLHVAC